MSDFKLIVDLVKAYNFKIQTLRDAINGEDHEAISRLSDGVFEDRMMIYDKLREEIYIASPDESIIQTLRSIRDNKGDHLFIIKKVVEEKSDERFEEFRKVHPGILERWADEVLEKEVAKPLSNDEREFCINFANSNPFLHVPDEEELDRGKYAREIATDKITELYEKHDLFDYWVRALDIGPILLVEKENKPPLSFFDEIRNCYSLGQYASSVILCRALLEEALKDFCVQTRPDASVGHKSKKCPKCKYELKEGKTYLLNSKEGKDKLWEYGLMKIVHDKNLSLGFDKTLKDKIKDVSEAAKKVVHGGKNVQQGEALEQILNTRFIIEELYA